MSIDTPKAEEVLISPDELARLHMACKLAFECYKPETQFLHLQEEMAELNLALSRYWRKRSTDEDILEEIVDVFQCCIQMGVHHYGPDKFNAMLSRKNDKFLYKFVKKENAIKRFGRWLARTLAAYGFWFSGTK